MADDAVARYLRNRPLAKPVFAAQTTALTHNVEQTGGTIYVQPANNYGLQADSTAPPPPAAPDAPADWYKALFAQYNLPGDIQSKLIDYLTRYASDPATGIALAQQYLRTTDWFAQTFPGFNEGVRAGLFTEETGYRGYVNSLNQVYQQYFGRAVSGGEVTAALQRGVSADYLGREFQGDAIAKTNMGDWQYLGGAFGEGRLSDAEGTALGREQAGIDTPEGQRIQRVLSRAQQRAQAIFSGTSASPAGLSISSGRLAASGLAGSGGGDVAA